MSAFANGARKSFSGNFFAKIDFLFGHFMVTITDVDIGSLKSLHTLFHKYMYLEHMLVIFEESCMVRNIQILSF